MIYLFNIFFEVKKHFLHWASQPICSEYHFCELSKFVSYYLLIVGTLMAGVLFITLTVISEGNTPLIVTRVPPSSCPLIGFSHVTVGNWNSNVNLIFMIYLSQFWADINLLKNKVLSLDRWVLKNVAKTKIVEFWLPHNLEGDDSIYQ